MGEEKPEVPEGSDKVMPVLTQYTPGDGLHFRFENMRSVVVKNSNYSGLGIGAGPSFGVGSPFSQSTVKRQRTLASVVSATTGVKGGIFKSSSGGLSHNSLRRGDPIPLGFHSTGKSHAVVVQVQGSRFAQPASAGAKPTVVAASSASPKAETPVEASGAGRGRKRKLSSTIQEEGGAGVSQCAHPLGDKILPTDWSAIAATPTTDDTISPHEYLVKILTSRGYTSDGVPARSATSSYCTVPEDGNVRDYSADLTKCIRNKDINALKSLQDSGVSMNACNKFGETIAHLASRIGALDLLQVMCAKGATVVVSDEYGRTILHDACWTIEPFFDVVCFIMEREAGMILVTDSRGDPPLKYVKRDLWGAFNAFLDVVKDRYWPVR